VAALLIAFGVVTILSIGLPFFALGLELAVLWPLRHRRRLVWSVLGLTALFFLTYLLFAPLTCTSTASSAVSGPGHVASTCTNPLGLRYAGGEAYQAPLCRRC